MPDTSVQQTIVKTRIQIRNDSATNWATTNPILIKGEMGVEADTRKFKFGDGNTHWNDLDYASCSGGRVINIENNGQYQSDAAAIEASAEAGNADPGDIAVVKTYSNTKLINTSSYQYSPVGNELKWVAIDGNVDASKVILNKDIMLAGSYTSVGNINKGNAASVKYEAKGKSVQDLLVEMLSKKQQPSKTEPSHTLTLTNAGATMASEYESGTTIHPRYSISFNAGSYSYDSSTGVTAQSYSVTDNQSHSGTTQTGNLGEVVLNDGITYQITSSSVNYSAGNVARDNLGDASSPAIQIAAGTTAPKSSITVTSYRNMYVGYSSKTTGFTSADIKGLTSIQAVKNAARTFNTLAENTSAASIVVAAPTGTRTLNRVVMPSSANADCTASFVKQSTTVDVLNAASQTAKYDIWVYAPAKMGGTYSITMG